jgi:hypothetical protein
VQHSLECNDQAQHSLGRTTHRSATLIANRSEKWAQRISLTVKFISNSHILRRRRAETDNTNEIWINLLSESTLWSTSRKPKATHLFKVMLVPLENFDASLLRSKRPHVPDTERVVHGVGENVWPVRRQGQACHRVVVALHSVQGSVLAQIPNLDKLYMELKNRLYNKRRNRHQWIVW